MTEIFQYYVDRTSKLETAIKWYKAWCQVSTRELDYPTFTRVLGKKTKARKRLFDLLN